MHDNKNNNIFLVGLMGTGKTTIGRQLSRRLKREFYDSDRVIEERTGADIPLIFEKEGEAGFRKRECDVIDELTRMDNIILATGGGSVLNEDNRRHLSSRGTVFYLKSNLETLVERTSKDKSRPLLHADEPPEVILKRLLEQREPLYEETADYVIHTANNSIQGIIKAIIGKMRLAEKKKPA
jgi:shikimate kinase